MRLFQSAATTHVSICRPQWSTKVATELQLRGDGDKGVTGRCNDDEGGASMPLQCDARCFCSSTAICAASAVRHTRHG